MPIYRYTAVTLDGKRKRGEQAAPDEATLRNGLKSRELILMEVRELDKGQSHVKLKTQEVADFCRQLATLFGAGVPLIRTLTILSQRDAKPKVQAIYTNMLRSLQQGKTLSDAMVSEGRAFPELLINMLRTAENSGTLDSTAKRMAEHYDREHKLNSKMKSASIYPSILLVLVALIVILLFTVVLPSFMPLFEKTEIPWATRFVMRISDAFVNDWLSMLIVTLLFVLAVRLAFSHPRVRLAYDRMKLRLPKVGKLLKIIYTSRFARTLASLYSSGIPMIQALHIVRNNIGNSYIAAQFTEAIEKLATGHTLSQSVSGIVGFDAKLISAMLVGEESGMLDHMLESMSDAYDYEAEMASQRLVSMMEPMMIIVMAVIVGFVMISTLLPIFNIYSSINQ